MGFNLVKLIESNKRETLSLALLFALLQNEGS